jgi:hypothetical protein
MNNDDVQDLCVRRDSFGRRFEDFAGRAYRLTASRPYSRRRVEGMIGVTVGETRGGAERIAAASRTWTDVHDELLLFCICP